MKLWLLLLIIGVRAGPRRPKRGDAISGQKVSEQKVTPSIDNEKQKQTMEEFGLFEALTDLKQFYSAPDCGETTVFWDEPFCTSYTIQGDLTVCGDLKVEGLVFAFSGVNVTDIVEGQPLHVQERCTKSGTTVDGSLLVYASDIYMVHIDGGSFLAVGLRGLKRGSNPVSRTISQESLEPFVCPVIDSLSGRVVSPDMGQQPNETNVTVGDLVSESAIFLDNAAMVFAFGNVVAHEVLLDDGSSLHSFCGQARTNLTDGAGIAVVDGSAVTFGGSMESLVVRLFAQDASVLYFKGGLRAAYAVQGEAVTYGGQLRPLNGASLGFS
eukprot:GHVN01001842.1.p1 GENE.GHVN01001842.1~~GHVN01001842.1.p1  ORF type:complete len:325 (+),score=35.98 GHVN01001842.1:1227-2201(+)